MSRPQQPCKSTNTIAANGILLKRAPFDNAIEREKIGSDLRALVAWFRRERR